MGRGLGSLPRVAASCGPALLTQEQMLSWISAGSNGCQYKPTPTSQSEENFITHLSITKDVFQAACGSQGASLGVGSTAQGVLWMVPTSLSLGGAPS